MLRFHQPLASMSASSDPMIAAARPATQATTTGAAIVAPFDGSGVNPDGSAAGGVSSGMEPRAVHWRLDSSMAPISATPVTTIACERESAPPPPARRPASSGLAYAREQFVGGDSFACGDRCASALELGFEVGTLLRDHLVV